jgi:hydrogenase maturation protein HypF
MGLGPELNNTGCLLKKNRAFLTQYIGDTSKLKTLEFLKVAVHRLLKFTGTEAPDKIAIDLHPDYSTRRLGEELASKFQVPLVEVQHHYAHAASLAAETRMERMVCLSLDGAGYGFGGLVWGGEVLHFEGGFVKRFGSLEPQLMPGGDLAAIYPARMVAGILCPHFDGLKLKKLLLEFVSGGFRAGEMGLVLKQLDQKFNTPLTTSTGRILDACASLLGVCFERTYEGEPAMKLEALAMRGKPSIDLPIKFSKLKGRHILRTSPIIMGVLEKLGIEKKEDIASSIQNCLAIALSELAIKCARQLRIDDIGISGGVAYNQQVVSTIGGRVLENGLNFHTHSRVPPGDGGISLGQCWYTVENP